MDINTGSFRDPFGQVFSYQNEIYRSIYSLGALDFENASAMGVYKRLVQSGFLIPHIEVSDLSFAPQDTVYCIKHPRIPFISYPWEWPFSMLKEAALLHLDVMQQLIPKGFWLRDASAFNVQYDGAGIRLIDTLSIGTRPPALPWVAYGQFCSHFLAPLALCAHIDLRLLALCKEYLDGIPLDLAVKLLPFHILIKPGLFLHIFLHAKSQQYTERWNDKSKTQIKPPHISDISLLGIIRSLRKTIGNLKYNPPSNSWVDYTTDRNYSANDVLVKTNFVKRTVESSHAQTIWDLGGNSGEYSILAAQNGAFVISIDKEPACTEALYLRIKQDKLSNILPLTMDLANPTPSLGWNHQERMSLGARGPVDLIIALAIIHHLVLASHIPLSLIARFFYENCSCLLVEYVPEDDIVIEKLLGEFAENHLSHLPYSLEIFESSFSRYFDLQEQIVLENGRSLYSYHRR